MKLKTSQKFAIEGAIQLEGSSDLKLLGSENVGRLGKEYSYYKSIDNSFLSVYGLDCKFFYIAQLYRSNKLYRYEVGIGYIQQSEGNFFLKRPQPLYFAEGTSDRPSRVVGPPCPFLCPPEDVVVVATYVPQSYSEILSDDNCIITSVAPHIPSIVYVDKNSIVGRTGDNIEAISINKLHELQPFNESVINSISNHTKQLLLKSSKLISKNITTDYVYLKPLNDKPPEKDGILFFNKQSGTICYYSENCWRELTWKRCLDENPS